MHTELLLLTKKNSKKKSNPINYFGISGSLTTLLLLPANDNKIMRKAVFLLYTVFMV